MEILYHIREKFQHLFSKAFWLDKYSTKVYIKDNEIYLYQALLHMSLDLHLCWKRAAKFPIHVSTEQRLLQLETNYFFQSTLCFPMTVLSSVIKLDLKLWE